MSSMMLFLAVLLVAVGGAVGSVGRWAIAAYGPRLVQRRWPRQSRERILPWMTFTANVLACLLLGVFVARLGSATGGVEVVYLLLSAGVCGGLSTLSTAALDVVDLVRRGTTAIALGYMMLTVGVSMTALWLGVVIAS